MVLTYRVTPNLRARFHRAAVLCTCLGLSACAVDTHTGPAAVNATQKQSEGEQTECSEYYTAKFVAETGLIVTGIYFFSSAARFAANRTLWGIIIGSVGIGLINERYNVFLECDENRFLQCKKDDDTMTYECVEIQVADSHEPASIAS